MQANGLCPNLLTLSAVPAKQHHIPSCRLLEHLLNLSQSQIARNLSVFILRNCCSNSRYDTDSVHNQREQFCEGTVYILTCFILTCGIVVDTFWIY